jgi:hypothetical protein
MCGPPDLEALFTAASRIFFTVLVLAGSTAAYTARKAISGSFHRFMEKVRQLTKNLW